MKRKEQSKESIFFFIIKQLKHKEENSWIHWENNSAHETVIKKENRPVKNELLPTKNTVELILMSVCKSVSHCL